MKTKLIYHLLLIIMLMPFAGFSTILEVPASFSTIQQGIDASVTGDTVLVSPGTYYENINLNGHNIVLGSWFLMTGNSVHIAGTVIDGGYNGRVVTISQGEDSTCQVNGFTIQHGSSAAEFDLGYGGGVFIMESSPRILHCNIQDNIAPGNGGGLAIHGLSAAPLVMFCTIRNNSAEIFGGGVFMGDCSQDAELVNCIISANTLTGYGTFNGGGGGVNLYHRGKLTNCLIINNSVPNSPVGGGGVYCDWGDYYTPQGILVTGCTIAGNMAMVGGGVTDIVNGGEFRNCIIWGNLDDLGNPSNYTGNTFENCCTEPLPSGTGNISANPQFINTGADNYRLNSGSPCINAGNNAFNNQSFDLDGNLRVIGAAIDMGAYESGTAGPVTVQVGSGTDLSEQLPVNTYYSYGYSQQIYLGTEISSGGGSAGTITKLRFYYAGGGSQFANWNNWTVYLGNTAKTEFTSISDWVPVSSMSPVFSGVLPDPVAGQWLEIILPAPFYYSGGNLVVAVDENTDNWDYPAQWASFSTVSPRGMIYVEDFVNPDPAAPPDANYGPDYSIPQIQLEIVSGFGALEGYITEEPGCTAPVVGATVTTGSFSATADATGFYHLVLPVGSFTDITAHHGDVSQTISPIVITQGNTTTQDFCLPPYFPPPVFLQASVNGVNEDNVHLTWLAPGSIADQWIHWDNGVMWGSLGYGDTATFSVASRWPVADIAPYDGTYLKKIRFVVTEATAAYTLKVWKGADAATLLHSQVVSNPIINGWNEIALSPPVLIDGTDEFWFGYEVVQTIGYPAGLAQGPAVAGKGDMFFNGTTWISMKNSWDFDFNWTIQGFVSENAMLAPHQTIVSEQNQAPVPVVNAQATALGKPTVVQNTSGFPAEPASDRLLASNGSTSVAGAGVAAPSSILTGYNVYKNNLKIADNISDLFYDDLLLPKGSYNYEVSAQYDDGESARIGPVHVNIYTCFPPSALDVPGATLTTTTANLTWNPSVVSTNPQWVLEWGSAGFLPGTGTTVFISTTPAYALAGLSPGTEYDFYVCTYCNATDTSAWIKKTFRTRFIACPANAIQEAEVCGTNTNGCDLIPPAFESISCGDTICGTSWLSHTQRDSDWYQFTITAPSDVTLSGKADFTNFMAIASAPCPTNFYYAAMTNGSGYSYSVVAQLAAGTYFVYVAPAYAEQVACDSLNRYWVSIACNSCLTPTMLTATNITGTSADLGWTSNAPMWNIEWGLAGFTKGSGTVISGVSANPYQLTGLTMGYAYSFYVQSDCGGGVTSNWAGPYSFTLPCPATTLPYSEDFSGQTPLYSPQCWQVFNYGGPTNWIVDYNQNAGGTSPELSFKPWNTWFSGSSYMTSPVINTSGQTELSLSFNHYINSFSAGTILEIYTTGNGGGGWASVWSTALAGTVGPENLNLTISTPDVGSPTFRFAFTVSGNSWDIGNWDIDDIVLTGMTPTGILEGTVTNCFNSGLLDGVTVTAGTFSTTTDALGFYQFPDLLVAGTYDVVFSLPGYVTKTVTGVVVQAAMTTTENACLNPTGPPVNATVQNVTVAGGQSVCYDATQVITVAGGGTTFIVQSGGSANMIAGLKINYLPGTRVFSGGYMHGKIAPGGPFCVADAPTLVMTDGREEEALTSANQQIFRIYPNPTNGNFTLVQRSGHVFGGGMMEIFNMQGGRMMSVRLNGEKQHEFNVAELPAGLYFVKVASDNRMETLKLVKTR